MVLESAVEIVSLSDLSNVIHPSELQSADRMTAVVRAYLDESSDEKKKYAYAVAGMLGSDPEWLCLELLWRDRTSGLKEAFHMSECETFNGQFEGWSVEQKTSLISDLVKHINTSILHSFGSSVDVQLFRSVFPSEPDDALYFLCFRHCVSQMAFWGSNVGHRVAFVFDQHKDFAPRALTLFNRLSKVPSSYQSGFGSITFEDRRKFVLLQAADLIAYETYKVAHHAGYDQARKIRRSIARLASTGRVHMRYWHEPALRALRVEMEKNGYNSLMDWMLTAEFMNLVPEPKK